MTNYKPGTVAVIRCRGDVDEFRAVKDDKGWSSIAPEIGWASDLDVVDIRPLAVLDIDAYTNPVQTLRLIASLDVVDAKRSLLLNIADQIEAQTKPQKTAEPTGLGAVVEDSEGVCWVRDWAGMWLSTNGAGRYAHINVVRVLSEGVQS